MFRRVLLGLALALLFPSLVAQPARAEDDRVQLDLFVTPGCEECDRVKREILPELAARFEGFYHLVEHDLTRSESVPLLLAYQERAGGASPHARVSLVVDHTWFIAGYETLATGLFDRVNEALLNRQDPAWERPVPIRLDDDEAREMVRQRASALTFGVVALGGLLDGFNPCAISTLIFFMSVLAVTKANRRTRLLMGISFISASFVVYMSLGLGFIFLFRQMPALPLLKLALETLLGLCMIPLAVFSFGDALRFRRSGRPDDVTLQIPKRIKARIHAFMSNRMGMGGPILGGLATGAGVTVLESVCTGQSYVPVLMYMLKQDASDLCAWLLLITYNLLFVLPLTVVFICFHRGMQIKSLIAWSRNNLVAVKILLGIFFTAMALLLLWPKGSFRSARAEPTATLVPERAP